MTGSMPQDSLKNDEIAKAEEKGNIILNDPSGSSDADIKLAQSVAGVSKERLSTSGEVNAGSSVAKVEGDDVPQFIKEQHVDKKTSPLVTLPKVQSDGGSLPSVSLAQGEARSDEVVPLPQPIAVQQKEVKKKKKIIWGDVFSCWVLGMGTLLIVLLLLLYIVVKSGILNIPYLSDWFYDAPLPTRYIEAGTMSWDEFRDLITIRLSENNLDNEPPVLLQISEQEFTAFLHGVITGGLRNVEYRAEVAQVVVLPDSIEMYFYLTWHDYITFEILTHLVPVVEDDGTLRLEVVDAKFGDLSLPGSWIIQLVGYVFARDVGVWKIVLSNGYGIQQSILVDQAVKLLIGPVRVK